MQVTSEELVETIVRAVIAELVKRGVDITPSAKGPGPVFTPRLHRSMTIDFSEYRTPVLTEMHVRAVKAPVTEIIIPTGTICTMGAKDLIQQRRLKLTYSGS